MKGKLRQVTDNIHGTIYLSEIESQMISTPFFYRLHDVYQSSTVYMTYPANRTKRYEHCLGTMELAGQMFFSSLANATPDDRERFMRELYAEFESVIGAILERERISEIFYFRDQRLQDFLETVLPEGSEVESILQYVVNGMRGGCIGDRALDHQKICFYDLASEPPAEGAGPLNEPQSLYAFLYQCILEALRVVSLFHDVGHPPYSHIIEKTLKDLYEEGKSGSGGFDPDKSKKLLKMLSPFFNGKAIPQVYLERDAAQQPQEEHYQLHEIIGLKMLQAAFMGVIRALIDPLVAEPDLNIATAKALYIIAIMEFSFAILLESKPIFASIHRILDGPVDADRLDYIVRDSTNAGIQWGQIPYGRMIRSCRLTITKDGTFAVAFPEKMVDDIDDLIVARYKVFGRINYHHRATKTAMLLQRAVRLLAEDYLKTPEAPKEKQAAKTKAHPVCICPEIKELWCALGDSLGASEGENKIARWTDSWLITALNSAFIVLSSKAEVRELCAGGARTEKDLQLLQKLLSEVLLNHKHYHSVLKRQLDAVKLMHSIMYKAGITGEKIESLISHEYELLPGPQSDEARDALYRIQILRDSIIQKADFELLGELFIGQSCEEVIENILEQAKLDGVIDDYLLFANPNRFKLGISLNDPKDNIYLYAPDGSVDVYDIHNTLYPLLGSYRTSNLWLNVYVKPAEGRDSAETVKSLTVALSNELAETMKQQFDEMFPPASYLGEAVAAMEQNTSPELV